jgi:DNA mismatch endonuclease (patch repair protein)
MDTLTPKERSERMSRVRNKDTKPEMRVRRLVSAMGYRYRLQYKKVPGRPDLAFPGRRKVIFVHGCFWHRHPDPSCQLARLPKSRLDFWIPKLEGNRARDLRKQQELQSLGWSALTIWECQLRDEEALREIIRTFLDSPGPGALTPGVLP